MPEVNQVIKTKAIEIIESGYNLERVVKVVQGISDYLTLLNNLYLGIQNRRKE